MSGKFLMQKDTSKIKVLVLGAGPPTTGGIPNLIMTLMEYAKLVAKKPRSTILARGHSGKTRPSDSVVDYITILFYS